MVIANPPLAEPVIDPGGVTIKPPFEMGVANLTGGEVKGNGVFIHEDGTGGYYLEFDWGDDDEKTKSKKSKVLYSDSSGVKKLDIPVLGERNNIGLQTDILISLMGANFSYKRKSNDAGF